MTDERIKKVWFIHIIEYHLALKKKKILSYVVTWMNIEGIVLSDVTVPAGQTLQHTTHRGYKTQAYSPEQRAEWRLPGERAWGVAI